MSEIYNEEYYHNGCGPIPYEEPEHWVEFFGMIADRIVKDIHPQTVLDAGCAMGYLVAALRDRGVEAYGIDISEYAVSKVREDVRPFCRVGSLTEEFPADLPQRYDLIVTIEVLEHLYAEDGKKAIANLCRHSDTVLFSSTPDDFTELTHVNVQQREYWARLFFEQGFTDDINYRPKYLTAYASLFRKNTDMARQVEDYERNIRMTEGENEKSIAALNQAVQDKETHICNLTAQHSAEQNEWTTRENDLNANIRKLEQDVQMRERTIAEQKQNIEEQQKQYTIDLNQKMECTATLEEKLSAAQREILDYSNLVAHEREEAARVAEAYRVISTSTFWKLTKPGRVFMDTMKKIFFRPLRKTLRYLRTYGLRATIGKIKQKCTDNTTEAVYMPSLSHDATGIQRNNITGHPVDPIAIIEAVEPVKRLNLVTDTIESSSLLGGVATALIVATEFANRYDYELRIITRNSATNPANYMNIMNINGIQPAKELSFYSDCERFDKPVDFRMEVGSGDIFFATSWWSAQAIKNTTIRPRFFYIIQEVETFFYNYGSEHFLCEQIMQDKNIDFIINSHYLKEYFAENCPNIAEHSCYFEPAFSQKLYGRNSFIKKNKYKLFFYARPNNPRNLYGIGVELLQKAVDRGVLDMDEWDVYCVGQNAPIIHFSTGKDSINMGQLSWTEYAKFLTDVDLGLCLMYTPHPSYPPFDVACSGGVVLTNKMLNKQSFEMCDNVVMTDLDDESFLSNFKKAVELAKNMEQRKRNYEFNTIPREWSEVLNNTMTYMEEAAESV